MELSEKGLSEFRVEVRDNEALTCHVDVTQIDPYEYPLFSFYRKGTLLGYLPYDHVRALEGCILLDQLMPSVSLEHANLYSLPSERPIISKDALFLSSAFFRLQGQNLQGVSQISSVHQRRLLERSVHIIQGKGELLARRPHLVEVLGCAQLAMIMRRFRVPLQMVDRTASRFEEARQRMEKEAFMTWMAPYVEPGAELNLLRLLVYHGADKDSLSERYMVNGDVYDNLRTISMELYRPRIYLRVHFREIPASLASTYRVQLRPGGVVHLHPAHAAEWLWQRCLLTWRQLNTAIWKSPYEKVRASPLYEVAREVFQMHMWGMGINGNPVYHPAYAPQGTPPSSYAGRKRKVDADDAPFEAKFKGVTLDKLPACMRLTRWPKRPERCQIGYNMRRAEIDIEDCADVLHQLRLKSFPQATRAETEREAGGVAYLYAKKYDPQGCKTHISNRGSQEAIIRCPYTAATEEGCKQQCMAELRSHYTSPPHYATASNLYYPHQYMRWRQNADQYAERTNTVYRETEEQRKEREAAEQEQREEDKKRRREEKAEREALEYWGYLEEEEEEEKEEEDRMGEDETSKKG